MALISQLVVIHERLGFWARHLRPRLVERPMRLIETRSSADLSTALSSDSAACPLVLIDLGRRPPSGLEDLDLVQRISPDALTLVLDPKRHDGVSLLARELGATHVIAGPTTPPELIQVLNRWFLLARHRAEAVGWSGPARESTEPEPWNWLAPYLNVNPSATTIT